MQRWQNFSFCASTIRFLSTYIGRYLRYLPTIPTYLLTFLQYYTSITQYNIASKIESWLMTHDSWGPGGNFTILTPPNTKDDLFGHHTPSSSTVLAVWCTNRTSLYCFIYSNWVMQWLWFRGSDTILIIIRMAFFASSDSDAVWFGQKPAIRLNYADRHVNHVLYCLFLYLYTTD
jgi:hypothetical protein